MKKTLAALVVSAALAGCATDAGTGAAWGAGLGAIAGGLYGGHGSDALIGAAIGTGIGYVVGNESDKRKANQMSQQTKSQNYAHSETGPFPGTNWRLVDWSPKSGNEGFKSKSFYFGNNGSVRTTTVMNNGNTNTDTESYRVVGDTLIVNKGDYIVNYKYTLQGSQLSVSNSKVRATLQRL